MYYNGKKILTVIKTEKASEGATATLQNKTITENGEHFPDSGFDGFSKVIVEVAPKTVTDKTRFNELIDGRITDITAEDLEEVETLRNFAFCGCLSITSVVIPENVTYIGEGAFKGCYDLTTVEMLSPNPPSIESGIFEGCDQLVEIRVPQDAGDAYRGADNWSDYADLIVE